MMTKSLIIGAVALGLSMLSSSGSIDEHRERLSVILGGDLQKLCDWNTGSCEVLQKAEYLRVCGLTWDTCAACPATNPCMKAGAKCSANRNIWQCNTPSEWSCNPSLVSQHDCGVTSDADGGTCSYSTAPVPPNTCLGGSPHNRCTGGNPCNGSGSVGCKKWDSCQ